jgi:hypothetical protein
VNAHDAAGSTIAGTGPQEQAVDQAEDPGIHADAEREDGNRGEGEAAVPGEHAQTETDILPQREHPFFS